MIHIELRAAPLRFGRIQLNHFGVGWFYRSGAMSGDIWRDLPPTSSIQRYGVWAHWEIPYLTPSPEYEATQMVSRGHIYRGRKPVHWSPSSHTALAKVELEYPEGHVSKSIYAVLRMISQPPASYGLFKQFFPDLCLAIWTASPWTIPANAENGAAQDDLFSSKQAELHLWRALLENW